ncbi:nephrocystin-3-like [Montipora capricornis]|uniref:nephrocystin-3-like n=1 Tax=Montipora capricornis TaxID=246305 RepID=UPI0035F17D5C
MGSGSSIASRRKVIDDDEFSEKFESGVTKEIPIECSTAGSKATSIKSVGSFGIGKKGSRRKKRANPVIKSFSLRSALSIAVDQEEGVDERHNRELELKNKVMEIAELERRKDKLHSENQRLRGEIKALQATCLKLRNERGMALEGKDQALQRATAFEKERDKVQRHFKIFRESKEREIQDLLHAKHEVELHSRQLLSVSSQDEKLDFVDNIATEPSWASSLASDPSVDSLMQWTSFRGPEFLHSPVDKDGPFTNISRDDWNAVAPSVHQLMSSSLQAPVQEPVIRVYLSAPNGMRKDVELFKQLYIPNLEWLCEKQGKFLMVVHFEDPEEQLSDQEFAARVQMRCNQIQNSKVFIAFLGEESNRFSSEEYNQAHFANPGRCNAIFCFKDPNWDGYPSLKHESIYLAEELKTEVRKAENVKLFDNYETSEKGAELAYRALKSFLIKELGLLDDQSVLGDHPLFGSSFWGAADDWEQVEALKAASECSCEIGLSKFYSDLNEHVSNCAAPKAPFVVKGSAGYGKSLLLAKWIALQQNSLSGRLVLYHFVGSTSSSSANPILMLQRFTSQLMKQLGSSCDLTSDPAQLEEEFPLWLQKAASKVHGGVTLVIDSADKLQGSPSHMQWLLDPLPAHARVILSVAENTCPIAWRAWTSLELCPLDFKGSVELLLSSLSCHSLSLPQEQVTKLLQNSSSEGRFCPRFLCFVAAELAEYKKKNLKSLLDYASVCFLKENTMDLLCHILGRIVKAFSHLLPERKLRKIFLYIFLARNGISESELLKLVDLTWSDWFILFEALKHSCIVVLRTGLLLFANEQVRSAVIQTFRFEEDLQEMKEAQESFKKLFEEKLSFPCISWRVADELPWSYKIASQKEKLKKCLLNAKVFKIFFERGRTCELLSYWHYLGVEQALLGEKYISVLKETEENELSAATAEMFEVVGRFLKCLGLLSQAAPLLQRGLEIRETILDPDHPLVAQSLHHLACLNAHWRKFTAAEAFFKQALEIKENTLGKGHPSLVKDLEGLAILYRKQEKHSMADSVRKRAEAIKQKANSSADFTELKKRTLQVEELARGAPSTELAKSLNELGVLYFLQNNHEAARSFFQRSLEMRESLLDPDHPDVAQSLHNLAALYNDQKMLEKAEPLYLRAYQIRLKAFQPHHGSIASTIKHLALLYKKQGKYAEAEPLYRHALEIRETTFGKSHPSVATALNNLAVVLCLQDRQSEALPLYERALQIYEDTLGGSHPRVAETLVNLAKLSFDLDVPEKAAQLYKRANDIREHGPAHPALSRRSSLSVLSNGSVRRHSQSPQGNDSVSRVMLM